MPRHDLLHAGAVQIRSPVDGARRSPSVNTPRTRFAGIDDGGHSEALASHFHEAVGERRVRAHSRHVSAHAHDVPDVQQSLRPRLPAGWERAKSSSVNPRAFSSATANASPTASAAVVLAVGARFNGQASAGTPMSRCTVAIRARADDELP